MSRLLPHHQQVGKTYGTSGLKSHGYDYELERLDRHSPVEYRMTLRYLAHHVPDRSSVADIGVGVGHYTEALARRGCTLTMVDVSSRLLDTAVGRLRDAGLGDRIAGAFQASATDLSFIADASQDAVLMLGPLYHLSVSEERQLALSEARRVLRPGGIFFGSGILRIAFFSAMFRDDPDGAVSNRAVHDHILLDGNLLPHPDGYPATVHMTTIEEFRVECSAHFEETLLAGTESFTSLNQASFLRASPENQERWLDIVEQTAPTPEGLGIADHPLFIGRKAV
jgi:ubiquinone/menaquinone biosynthesis C-methylase UbiE